MQKRSRGGREAKMDRRGRRGDGRTGEKDAKKGQNKMIIGGKSGHGKERREEEENR